MKKVTHLADLIARRNRPLIEIERERRAQQREQDRDPEQEQADIELHLLSEVWKGIFMAREAMKAMDSDEAMKAMARAEKATEDLIRHRGEDLLL